MTSCFCRSFFCRLFMWESYISLIEAKTSKGMHQVCIVYIRTENSSTGCVGFVKYFDIAVFCLILNQSGQL